MGPGLPLGRILYRPLSLNPELKICEQSDTNVFFLIIIIFSLQHKKVLFGFQSRGTNLRAPCPGSGRLCLCSRCQVGFAAVICVGVALVFEVGSSEDSPVSAGGIILDGSSQTPTHVSIQNITIFQFYFSIFMPVLCCIFCKNNMIPCLIWKN